MKLCRHKSCFNCINGEEWKTYFSELLNISNPVEEDFSENIEMHLPWHDINCEECRQDLCNVRDNSIVNKDSTLIEVEKAIESLDVGKAPGMDGICNHILKEAKFVIVPMLCVLFNKLIETGIYPDEWGSAIIFPIHKKGDVSIPDNYRRISLLSCVSSCLLSNLEPFLLASG